MAASGADTMSGKSDTHGCQDDIDPKGLQLCLQGIRDLSRGRVVAVEARHRYRASAGQLIGTSELPGYFRARTSLARINLEMLDTALQALRALHLRGYALELTARVFLDTLAQPDLADWLRDRLETYRLPPETLVLALREGGRTRCPSDMTCAALEALRAIGARIALDEMAYGPNALMSIRRFDPDILRVSSALIAGDPACGDHRCVASSMRKWTDSFALVRFGRERGLAVVATGVTTSEQLDIVTRMGFDAAQGPGLGAVVSAGRFQKLLSGTA